jgi:hypothetical protein
LVRGRSRNLAADAGTGELARESRWSRHRSAVMAVMGGVLEFGGLSRSTQEPFCNFRVSISPLCFSTEGYRARVRETSRTT